MERVEYLDEVISRGLTKEQIENIRSIIFEDLKGPLNKLVQEALGVIEDRMEDYVTINSWLEENTKILNTINTHINKVKHFSEAEIINLINDNIKIKLASESDIKSLFEN